MSWVYPLDHDHGLDADELTARVGGKGANLGVMARELGLPVPPGIALVTDASRAYLDGGWPAGLDDELREGIAVIERALGRRFGDPADPLLVSVRSGAPVSMPGMMDTILNVGLTRDAVPGLATISGDPAFAADCARRLDAMFASIVGVAVPDDPWSQLRLAVEAVFRSWRSERARAYREREGIPESIGTGVVVQAMVFGNHDEASATGVAFTRNPASGEPGLYGDVLFRAQGEDVVAGTHATEPLAALDRRLPDAAAALRAHAALLERHYRDLCDIEFTIESGRLWMLQVRVGKRSPLAALRIAREMADDPTFPLDRAEAVSRVRPLLAAPPRVIRERPVAAEPLARGLPASPGSATGPIAFTPDGAIAAADAGTPAILVRPETSPDDVHGMARAAGVLTATGGLTSHAAVVARGWGIPAVVGATELRIGDGVARLAQATLREGETITIDGASGDVFRGAVGSTSEIAPDALVLRAWARDLGIEVAEEAGDGSASGGGRGTAADPMATAPSSDDCLRTIDVKGFALPAGLAEALHAPVDAVESLVTALAEAGLVERAAGAYRASEQGRTRAAALLAAERDALGPEAASSFLDDFISLDRRVKELVTAWQLRPGDGEPVVNDHADEAYDRDVLGRLAAFHDEVAAWLGPLAERWARAGLYRRRLDLASRLASDGDVRYVASPRVDSYHGTWFELHEELIRLAGRTREDEVAAGRA